MAANHRRMKTDRIKEEVYSLWFMPKGQIADDLQALIIELSRRYSTPKFQPHVTLIGELALPPAETIDKIKDLAALLKPFTIRMKEVTYLNEYFRCLFIKAARTEALIHAHSTANKVFKQDGSEYMPHLSLVYGDLETDTKQEIIREIDKGINIEFLAKEIYLYNTAGNPEEWYCLLETALRGS